VVIYIAGNVFMSGYSNQGKHLFVLFARVEYHKINLYLYLLKKINRIQEIIIIRKIMQMLEKMGKEEIFLTDLVDRGVIPNQIKTLIMDLEHLVEIITYLEIPTEDL